MINLVIWFKSGKSERFKKVKNFDAAVSHNGALFIQFECTQLHEWRAEFNWDNVTGYEIITEEIE